MLEHAFLPHPQPNYALVLLGVSQMTPRALTRKPDLVLSRMDGTSHVSSYESDQVV